MAQRYREHDTSTGAALSVTLDTGQAAQPIVEIFVKSNLAAAFQVAGSSDGINFRDSIVINVITPSFEKVQSLSNAFRYVRVSTLAAQNNEIEIVATG